MVKLLNRLMWAVLLTASAGYAQTSIQQQAAVLRNDGTPNGIFTIGLYIKGTNLPAGCTLGSFTIDILYDHTILQYTNATAWAFGLADGYNRFANGTAAVLRVGGTGGGVNQDGGGAPAGFDVTAEYKRLVELNFTILNTAAHADIRIDPGSNQIGLFMNHVNNPNNGVITNQVLTTPEILTDVPLPVVISSFTAALIGGDVRLMWKTATETDNFGFEIERSVHSQSGSPQAWMKIGFVSGAGTANAERNYSYSDKGLMREGVIRYRLKQIDRDGHYSYSKEIEIRNEMPHAYGLAQNYPNPFNPSTSIQFDLPAPGVVMLSVFNVLGERVADLVHGSCQEGHHSVTVNAAGWPSGLYFYRLSVNGMTMIRSMQLIK